MITQVYKDDDGDMYGRRAARMGLSGGMGFLTTLPAVLGAGAIGGSTGNQPSAGGGCATCPPGCRTETRKQVYYARPARTSPNDVAIKVARKIVKCEDVSGVPQIACDQTGVNGLNGLNGCSSCSGNYSNRM